MAMLAEVEAGGGPLQSSPARSACRGCRRTLDAELWATVSRISFTSAIVAPLVLKR